MENKSNNSMYIMCGILERKKQKRTFDSAARVLEMQEFFLKPNDSIGVVMFPAYEEVIAKLEEIEIGQHIEVHFNVSSRQYRRKWFTNVVAKDIFKINGQMEIPPSR